VIGRLDLIMLIVGDLERSARFYGDVLGLPVRYRTERWTEFAAGEIRLALHLAGDDVGVSPTTGCTFAFVVDDVEGAVGELRAHGTLILQEPHREAFGGVLAVISDPDGYRIQLLKLDAAGADRSNSAP